MSKPPPHVHVRGLDVGSGQFIVLSYALDTSAEPALADRLSPAEAKVAAMVIEGLSNAAIAARRGTSARTVANQVASILRKLALESRRDLMARVLVTGRLRPPP
ncbi:MAG: helix-turn-helix transcriptional regulator [Sandaracinaceae bacterium]|nr:helix-turn-helix transcriptional regulator [Sandaracinaceae bacterium]